MNPIDSAALMDAIEVAASGIRGMEHLRNLELACTRDHARLLEERRPMLANPQGLPGWALRRDIHAAQRLVAFAFICYVVAYIDRVNIGFVNAILQRRLGLSNEEFAWGAGLFFFGYFLFEIPSNLILERFGARRWIARIMIVWGLVSMATIFVAAKWSFYGMRFLLGLAEPGFFPGIVLYLTYWIPGRERARNGALSFGG